jgi:hypothetical protein
MQTNFLKSIDVKAIKSVKITENIQISERNNSENLKEHGKAWDYEINVNKFPKSFYARKLISKLKKKRMTAVAREDLNNFLENMQFSNLGYDINGIEKSLLRFRTKIR